MIKQVYQLYVNDYISITIIKHQTQHVEHKTVRLKPNTARILDEGFNGPLSIMDKIGRQKISKAMKDLNTTRNQQDLSDIYKPRHLKLVDYIFLSASHRMLSRIKQY